MAGPKGRGTQSCRKLRARSPEWAGQPGRSHRQREDPAVQLRDDSTCDDGGAGQVLVRREQRRLQTRPHRVHTHSVDHAVATKPFEDVAWERPQVQTYATRAQAEVDLEQGVAGVVVDLLAHLQAEDDAARDRLADANPGEDRLDEGGRRPMLKG